MKRKLFTLLLVAALLAGCGAQKAQTPLSGEAETTAPVEPRLPDFTAYDDNGQPVKLSDYLGKPIVLNFWASWCGPCKSEMPGFQAVYEELGDRVQFLMVDVGEHMDEGSAFIASAGYSFPVLYDVNGEAAYAYQLSAIPATYLIDADGNITDSHVGAMQEADLRAAIETILPQES